MSGSGDQATWTIENGVCTMVFERRIKAPIQRVWHALTDHRELAQWFFPIDGHLMEGSEIVIRWDEEPLHSTVIARETPIRVEVWLTAGDFLRVQFTNRAVRSLKSG